MKNKKKQKKGGEGHICDKYEWKKDVVFIWYLYKLYIGYREEQQEEPSVESYTCRSEENPRSTTNLRDWLCIIKIWIYTLLLLPLYIS